MESGGYSDFTFSHQLGVTDSQVIFPTQKTKIQQEAVERNCPDAVDLHQNFTAIA